MNDKAKIALGVGLVAAMLFASKKLGAFPGGNGQIAGTQLSHAQTREIILGTLASGEFPDVSAIMLATVIEIESARYPFAVRAEEHIGDFSAGLAQTLVRTARSLFDMGYNRYPRPDFLNDNYAADDPRRVSESPAQILFDPYASAYYGAAALQDVAWYGGGGHSEEWIIRAYNGGPTWESKGEKSQTMTAQHWSRYLSTKDRIKKYYMGEVSISFGGGAGF